MIVNIARITKIKVISLIMITIPAPVKHVTAWTMLWWAEHILYVTYSVCSLVVPTLEEAILTSVLKKNFKWPSILGQEGHSYSPKHSNLSYDQFGGRLEQSDTAPLLLPPGWRDTDSFSWICSVFNSSISRRSWNLFLCPCKWALRLKERWLNRWTWTTKRRTRPPTRWWTTCLQAR